MFKKTHASITKGLTVMINDLDALTKANDAKAKANTQQIARLTEANRMFDMENKRCATSIAQLRKIVGDEIKS